MELRAEHTVDILGVCQTVSMSMDQGRLKWSRKIARAEVCGWKKQLFQQYLLRKHTHEVFKNDGKNSIERHHHAVFPCERTPSPTIVRSHERETFPYTL